MDEAAQLEREPVMKIRPSHNKIKAWSSINHCESYPLMKEWSNPKPELTFINKLETNQRNEVSNIGFWLTQQDTHWISISTVENNKQLHCLGKAYVSYDVVMELLEPFQFQGYILFIDNCYICPALLLALSRNWCNRTSHSTTVWSTEAVQGLTNALNGNISPEGQTRAPTYNPSTNCARHL